MTNSRPKLSDVLKAAPVVAERKGPGPEKQFIHLRPALQGRESLVLDAVLALPPDCRTPSVVASALARQSIGIPYSSICATLRRLERKCALTLNRVRP